MAAALDFPPEETAVPDEEAERLMRVEAFAEQLRMKRSDAIKARSASGVEMRWIADSDAYHGRDAHNKAADLMDTLRTGAARQSPDKKQARRRSTQFVQKTRQKTNAAAAHLAELLFPTDDRNWRLKPTPVPILMDSLKKRSNQVFVDPMVGGPLPHPEENRPLTEGEVAADQLRTAADRCEAMQTEIDDQLVECQYNAEGRKVIEDAARLGTGVMRGPIVVSRTRKAWIRRKGSDGKSFYEAETKIDNRPASNRVDPWDCYPAPGCGDNIHKGSYFWERELASPAHLRSLAKLEDEGFNREAILACLHETPTRAREATNQRRRDGNGEYIDSETFDSTNYELWHYCGEASPDDLRALGVEVSDDMMLKSISAMVVMCNDRVIRAMLNPSDFGDIPYDFFVWERVDGSPFGVGVPYLMRYAQKAMNSSWRQMQDNAGWQHAPIIAIRRSAFEPADRTWEMYGGKVLYGKDDVDLQKALVFHQAEDRQQSLEKIFQIANQLADEETSMPQLMQGEKGEAPDKVGVARILVNGASVMLKRYAKQWDDSITSPHLRRYYDWNMQYSEKEDIKGDFSVHALGATHLVVKDQLQQDIANTAAMAQNPMYARYINPKKLAEAQVRATAIKEVLYTEDELAENERKEAQQPPPEDPRIEAAKIATQGRLQIEQIKAEGAIKAEQVEAQSEIRNQELRAEEAARNDERELAKLNLELTMMYAEFAQERGMQVDQLKAEMAQKLMDMQSKQSLQRETAAATERSQAMMGKFGEGKE
jgi:hypothetical protein